MADYVNEVETVVLLTVFLRTVFFYFTVLVFVRLMGKREIGQLSPFDLVVSIMIAEAAVMAIDDPNRSIWMGIIPVTALAGLQIGISWLCLKYPTIQTMVNGQPTVIIEGGKINEENMRRSRFTVHELMEQLRLQNAPALADVEYAILEMSGKLSVMPTVKARNLQPSDLKLDLPQEGLPATLIVDGIINQEGLKVINRDKHWLMDQLQQNRITDPGSIFVAAVDRAGKLWIQQREDTQQNGDLQP